MNSCRMDGNMRKFSYAALVIASNNFSSDRLIGLGGFARVYRGDLPDGTLVAVKYYYDKHIRVEEFLRNMEVMSPIRHRNILRVIGCCIEKRRPLLVTEYAENGSLYDLLHDPEREKKSSVFNWPRRAAVCMGIARGLSYLHRDAIPQVIHRDIKSANILLDSHFTPKIADFDAVKLIYDLDESFVIQGTIGYMPPEYVQYGFCSDKLDVYAFGVVMLEILSGRRAFEVVQSDTDEPNYITLPAMLVGNHMEVSDFIDPALQEHGYPMDAAQSLINVAVLCVHEEPTLRPNMEEVMHILYGVCNSSRLSLRCPDMSTLDDQSHGNVWQGYSIGASTSINPEMQVGMVDEYPYLNEMYAEMMDDILARQEVETCIEQEDREQEAAWYSNFAVTGTSTEAEDTCSRTSTEAEDTEDEGQQCSILQSEKAETSTAQAQNQQRHFGGSEVQTHMSTESEAHIHGSIQQRQKQPGIIRSGSDDIVESVSRTMVFKKYDFPEAVYPPFPTSVHRQRGPSRFHGSYGRPFP